MGKDAFKAAMDGQTLSYDDAAIASGGGEGRGALPFFCDKRAVRDYPAAMNSPLLGKIALVTGSGRGIGAATALRLAQEGADILVNDIQAGGARETAAAVTALGRRSWVSTHDVSDYEQTQELAALLKRECGGVDILVNNAGITRDAMLTKMSEAQWDEVIQVNLKGPFNIGQACAKFMVEKKAGRIINIASVSWLGNIGQSNYSASKAGLVGLTRTWALELSRYGIQVNAIAPGFVVSALTQKMPPDVLDKFTQRIPAKRLGQPADIAGLVSFLAGPDASYMTGQCIQMDGGLSVGASSG